MNPLVEEALRFSSIRHGGQFRNGSSIPYLSHPFSVAMLLESDHQAPVVVAAGLLHDVIEDTKTDHKKSYQNSNLTCTGSFLRSRRKIARSHGSNENG